MQWTIAVFHVWSTAWDKLDCSLKHTCVTFMCEPSKYVCIICRLHLDYPTCHKHKFVHDIAVPRPSSFCILEAIKLDDGKVCKRRLCMIYVHTNTKAFPSFEVTIFRCLCNEYCCVQLQDQAISECICQFIHYSIL